MEEQSKQLIESPLYKKARIEIKDSESSMTSTTAPMDIITDTATTTTTTAAAVTTPSGLETLLSRPTVFGNETGQLPNGYYNYQEEKLYSKLHNDCKVLVVGAGGLGCEILKDLALSNISNIHIIDLDTIDISNLNRQFLFRNHDIGRSKAEVAAEFIMKRVPHCKVTPYKGKIQDYDENFYKQFNIIISGLDNIEARRWLNSLLLSLVEVDDDGDVVGGVIPLIDGGTEGLKGQARVILPKFTACFECTLESFPPPQAFPMCTIAETPRIPEHCIAYAYMMEWDRYFPNKKLDKDSPDDMKWVYEKANERALKYGIQGVTYFKTIGVVKNIIPAVASTNAIISAICVAEAIKLLTFCNHTVNNYYMFMGQDGLYTPTFQYEKNESCPVCSDAAIIKNISINESMTLEEFIEYLNETPSLQLKKPSIAGVDTNLFIQNPPSLRKMLEGNLSKSMKELIEDDEILTITDPSLRDTALSLRITFN